jgi:hypothetical protein
MPQQNHRFFVVISSLKYTLQNVVFLSTKKANLLFCEHLWRLLLIYASQPSAKASITSAKRYAGPGSNQCVSNGFAWLCQNS